MFFFSGNDKTEKYKIFCRTKKDKSKNFKMLIKSNYSWEPIQKFIVVTLMTPNNNVTHP